MEKKIEQYLPLYLGQKVRYRHNWSKAEPIVQKLTTRKLLEIEGDNTIADVQLILRPLSSMTEEEKLELYGMGFTCNNGMQILHPAEWNAFKPTQFRSTPISILFSGGLTPNCF